MEYIKQNEKPNKRKAKNHYKVTHILPSANGFL